VDPVPADVRFALIRQWDLISEVVDTIDLAAASRCNGWTNREVLAHLYVQPHLVKKFLGTASVRQAEVQLSENLAGTKSFSGLINESARKGATLNKVDLRRPLAAVRDVVLAAPLDATITTLQGKISVSDYLVTRCVEAVVHGSDLSPRVTPDPVAEAITSEALLDVLELSAQSW
jgi:uncharacterized protein (TIGR03083 family)